MDSNEYIKKTIDETAKRHTQLELLKKVRVYETKRMDIDAVKENTFRRKYEYDEDYGTESFNKEVQKQKNKLVEIKKRKFKNCLIKFAIATTIIAGTVGTASYVKGYKKGFNNGKKVTTESIEKEYLKKNDLSTAPNIIVDKWADASISKFDEYIQNKFIDGVDIITYFRNKIVHPSRKRNKATLYVKQFIAEKKHNILLVMDTGLKMKADTSKHQKKKDVALFTAGTIGYLAIKNSDYVGMIHNNLSKIEYQPFKSNLYNLEEYLCNYDKNYSSEGNDINSILEFVYKNIHKKMITFIITDIDGVNNIRTDTLKKLNQKSDVLVVNIDDNYMIGDEVYDIDDDRYISKSFLNDPKLHEMEREIRTSLLKKNKLKLKKKNTSFISIDSIENINFNIIKLLEEHKNVGIN